MLPVVIHERVRRACRWRALGIVPCVIVVPSGDSTMLIVTPVLFSLLRYGGGGLFGLLRRAIVHELDS